MPVFKSDIITKKEAATLQQSNGLVNGDDVSGTLLYATAKVSLPNTTAANDTLPLFDLPPGAVLVPQLSHVACSANPGATFTLDVGDDGIASYNGSTAVDADADRYADGMNLASGGVVAFCAPACPAAALSPLRAKVPLRITAKVATIATPAAADLVFTIAYRVKG
jgi:hypothetical protein